MQLTANLLIFALAPAIVLAVPQLPERQELDRLVKRQSPDPCCKRCGPIGKVLASCPPPAGVYCGCDEWVAAAPGCNTCISESNYTSSYVSQPGPFLEWFWGFCRCKKPCRAIAEALSGLGPCATSTDPACTPKTFVATGDACVCCLQTVDPWMAAQFKGFVVDSGMNQAPTPGTISRGLN